MRILTANDLTAGSANALRRAAALAAGAGSELRVIHSVPAIAGRTGVAHLLHGSVAETALRGCPSDMLIIRTSAEEAFGS